jgi:HD-GYP domain-containing protein (c-di-GMP phosphodiesterase class II)
VKLVPFSSQYLRLHEPLPFGVYDAAGRLLLAASQLVDNHDRLAELTQQPLFAQEQESADWHRRLAAAMDQKLRQGASLKELAAVRPADMARETVARKEMTLGEQWLELSMQLDSTLRDVRPGSDWRSRLMQVHARVRALAAKRLDASLYHLVYEAGHSTEKYSAQHALLCCLMGELACPLLGIEGPALDSLGRAALTMNVAMQRLQDQLAATQLPPTPAQRAEIEAHAAQGARQLREAGLGDERACQIVALHHDNGDQDTAWGALAPERQLARLLRRVDIFAAKISRRATRAPMSPVQAAREACLGAGGVPDEVGGALLKAVGLYPPGSFVELVCGELGIVVARGRRANLPYVASLVSASGNPLGEPTLRDTIDRRFAVRAAVPPAQVRVRPPHDRLMALRI